MKRGPYGKTQCHGGRVVNPLPYGAEHPMPKRAGDEPPPLLALGHFVYSALLALPLTSWGVESIHILRVIGRR